ncbi:MAG TPA: xanthine dehydrogenase family protein subunit M [Actinomycetota bacterium]|nr:xanthine dehydrogenase family protein subunit M [Actinomycetota bacterium]
MLPPRFDYRRPTTLDEAIDLLGEHGDEAKVLAGGQSLIPLLKLRLASPSLLVDVNRIPGLDGIAEEGGVLRIGALVRHATLEREGALRDRYPAIAAAAPQISDPLVRNLGTVGGSLAHADPSGDWGAVMLAVGATVVARSRRGEREIPVRDLFRDTFTTALEPDELLTEIRVPAPAGPVGGTYLKLERKVGDFATVAVAVHVEMQDGRIGRAGIGLAAVGPTNLRAEAAEAALAGAEPTEEAFAEAAHLAAEAASPVTDIRGSAEYKRHVVEVYVRRGLAAAVERARAA